MAEPKAENKDINYKISKNIPNTKETTDSNTTKHFENESLEEQSSFSKKENVNGKENLTNDFVVAVGSVVQPENRNVLPEVNSYFSDSTHEGSMKIVAEGKHIGIATSNFANESGEHSENGENLTEPSNYCIDFQKGSADMVGANYPLGVATNLQNTISGKIASIPNMTMITGVKREEPTDNEEVLSEVLFKESSTMSVTISLQRDIVQSTVSERNSPHSGNGDVDGKDRSILCKLCCLSFSCFKSLEDHLRCTHVVESDIKRFKCESCNKGFQASSVLMTHLLNFHTEEKIYSCGECGISFPYPHTTTARRITKFFCGRCQTVVNDAKIQKMKIKKEEHLPVVNTHSCEFCQEVFSIKFGLERHLHVSHGLKPHVCELCGKKYGFLSSLKRHLLAHNREPYKVKKMQARIQCRNLDVGSANLDFGAPTPYLKS